MSLGWQCESALLPSNSKPINVDGKSLVGLKALLYDEQQRTKIKDGDDGHRRLKSGSFTRKDVKDKIQHTNKDVPKKRSPNSEVEPDVLAALTAKTKLYEEISQGKVQLQSELINFEDKIIPDEIQAKPQSETRTETSTQGLRHPHTNLSIVPPPKPPTMPNPAKRTERVTIGAQSSSEYGSEKASGSQASAQPHYNWSTTYGPAGTDNAADTDYTSNYRHQLQKENELKRTIEDRVRLESELKDKYSDAPETRVSEAARVKTQWEKTLNSSARGFLDQVHDDVATQRAVVSDGVQKRTAREEKMEQIRLKRMRVID